MATQKRTIGKLPVYRGDYVEGTSYSRLNIVTYLGSAFISNVDGNTAVPCVVEGDEFVVSYGWGFFADASAAYLWKQTEVDLPQSEFEAKLDRNELDTTKRYYTYEEE